jgi:hypothetical protein
MYLPSGCVFIHFKSHTLDPTTLSAYNMTQNAIKQV